MALAEHDVERAMRVTPVLLERPHVLEPRARVGGADSGSVGIGIVAWPRRHRVPVDVSRWAGPLWFGLSLAGVLLGLFYIAGLGVGLPVDAHAYYVVNLDRPYLGSQVNGVDAYLYSPAFAQAIAPLRALPWDTFRTLWRLIELAALVVMAGPFTPVLLFLSPIASEINAGNIDLLMPLAIVSGFRWPAAWAFILLTKVSPGIGLLWFLLRGEWRALAVALGATAVIAGASFALASNLWIDWARLLAMEAPVTRTSWEVIMVPLAARLAAAGIIVAWGARNDRRWALPIAAFIASPVSYWQTLAILVAIIPLAIDRPRRFLA